MGLKIWAWMKSRKILLICCVAGLALFAAGLAVGAAFLAKPEQEPAGNLGGSFSGRVIRNIRIIASEYPGIGPETPSDPFAAELRLFPFEYAPADWLLSDGQTVQFSERTIPLIVLINFRGNIVRGAPVPIPDYRGKAPIPANAADGKALQYYICVGGYYPPMADEWPTPVHTMDKATFCETSGDLNDFFMGEIQLVAEDLMTDPDDTWARFLPCDGRELKTSMNAELESILGTRFGGDGKTTFKIPDLRGQSPVAGYVYAICVLGLYPTRG